MVFVVYKKQKYISHSSGSEEGHHRGTSKLGVAAGRGPYPDSQTKLLPVASSHGGKGQGDPWGCFGKDGNLFHEGSAPHDLISSRTPHHLISSHRARVFHNTNLGKTHSDITKQIPIFEILILPNTDSCPIQSCVFLKLMQQLKQSIY